VPDAKVISKSGFTPLQAISVHEAWTAILIGETKPIWWKGRLMAFA